MEPRTGVKLLKICLAESASSVESAGTTLWTQMWSKRSGLRRRTSWSCSASRSRAQSGASSRNTCRAALIIKSRIGSIQTCRRNWMTSPNLAPLKSITAWMSHNRNLSLALSTHMRHTMTWSKICTFQSKLWVPLIARTSLKSRQMKSHRLPMTLAKHAAPLSWRLNRMPKLKESCLVQIAQSQQSKQVKTRSNSRSSIKLLPASWLRLV